MTETLKDDPAVFALALAPGPVRGPLVSRKDLDVRVVRTSDLDSGEFFARSELLDRTGATPTEFSKIEHRGLVISRHRTVSGRRLYTQEHVERVIEILKTRRVREEPLPRIGRPPTRGYSQEQARIAFTMLRDGKPREDIFLALNNIHPTMFQAICEQYNQIANAITISPKIVEEIHACPIEGFELPLKSGEDVARLIRHLTKPRACETCGERAPSEHCTRCVKAIFESEERRAAKEKRMSVETTEIEAKIDRAGRPVKRPVQRAKARPRVATNEGKTMPPTGPRG